MSFSPSRQIKDLYELLSRAKQDIGLLLGAGCPSGIDTENNKPYIPNIQGLTEKIKESLYSGDLSSQFKKITEDMEEPNIEEILTKIRGLKRYIGNGDSISKLTIEDMENLEKKVSKEIFEQVKRDLPNYRTPYHSLAIWVRSIDREKPVQIFTTNYDLLLEQAFEQKKVPFFDGFIGSDEPFFDSYAMEYDEFPPRWVRLWKVHGSINWKISEAEDTVKVYRVGENTADYEDLVIHPSHFKYEESRKMPFLAMMDKLRNFLNAPSNVLITIGYSFGDQHLNDVILQGLQGSNSSAVFGLLYEKLENYPEAKSLASKIGNLTLLAKDKAVIGTTEERWEADSNKQNSFQNLIGNLEGGSEESDFTTIEVGDFASFGNLLKQITGSKERSRSEDGQ